MHLGWECTDIPGGLEVGRGGLEDPVPGDKPLCAEDVGSPDASWSLPPAPQSCPNTLGPSSRTGQASTLAGASGRPKAGAAGAGPSARELGGSLLCSARFYERASDPPAAPLNLPVHPGHLGAAPLPAAPRPPAPPPPRPAPRRPAPRSPPPRSPPPRSPQPRSGPLDPPSSPHAQTRGSCERSQPAPRGTRAARELDPPRRELSWRNAPGRFPAAFSVNRGCSASHENNKFPVTFAANAGCSRNSAASRKPRSFLIGEVGPARVRRLLPGPSLPSVSFSWGSGARRSCIPRSASSSGPGQVGGGPAGALREGRERAAGRVGTRVSALRPGLES
ncbi:sulfated surface glycoprotein 185-like [Piliocolobus tephrosceles]|uniref:sulfated surface glycoprotein 185-like n=1 Tax=Piliocolobus tephrosceles TaxID=591936 RepID=UPI000E6B1710|nr:sulfated surface glycoprotein 185-like [Piliocolobus tephrosceles]